MLHLYDKNEITEPMVSTYANNMLHGLEDLLASIKNLKKEILSKKNELENLQMKKKQYDEDIKNIIDIKNKILSNLEAINGTEKSKKSNISSVLEPKADGKTSKENEILLNSTITQNIPEFKFSFHSKCFLYKKANILINFRNDTQSVICCVRYDPTGNCFAYSTPRNLIVCDSETGKTIITQSLKIPHQRLEIHSRALAFSSDGSMIAAAIAPNYIGLFSIVHRKLIKTFSGHYSTITSIVFSPDSSMIYSGGVDGNICVWSLATMGMVKKIQVGELNNETLISKDGAISAMLIANQTIIVGFYIGMVSIYSDMFNNILFSFKAHNDKLISMAITQIGELVTVSSEGVIKIWELTYAGAICKVCVQGHSNIVSSVCCSLTNKIMMTGSKDKTIKVWNSQTGEYLFTLSAHTETVLSLAHHPFKGMFLSASGDGTIISWKYPSLPI